MTGFARVEGQAGDLAFVFEGRSVNGRGLEARFRLPPGHEGLEVRLRAMTAERFKRGNLQVSLQIGPGQGARGGFKVNWAAVEELAGVLERLATRLGASPPSLDGVLSLRGILETGEPIDSEAARGEREAALIEGYARMLDGLAAARRAEGDRLAPVLEGQIAQIESLAQAARGRVAVLGDGLRARLRAQIQAVLDQGASVSEERLAQELALLLVKADVGEELDRLAAHVAAAREMLASPEAQGRRFDFLAQEFHREANTLCSKSVDIDLTRVGIELKTVIDQFREQVQNIE